MDNLEEIVQGVHRLLSSRRKLSEMTFHYYGSLVKDREPETPFDSAYESITFDETNTSVITNNTNNNVNYSFLSEEEFKYMDNLLMLFVDHVCDYINDKEKFKNITSFCLSVTIASVRCLSETNHIHAVELNIQKCLETALKHAFNCDSNEYFNFLMELCRQFSLLNDYKTVVFNILLTYLERFVIVLKKKVNARNDGMCMFVYERDISRSNTILLLILDLQRESELYENDEKILSILQHLHGLDDYFPLAFVAYKCSSLPKNN